MSKDAEAAREAERERAAADGLPPLPLSADNLPKGWRKATMVEGDSEKTVFYSPESGHCQFTVPSGAIEEYWYFCCGPCGGYFRILKCYMACALLLYVGLLITAIVIWAVYDAFWPSLILGIPSLLAGLNVCYERWKLSKGKLSKADQEAWTIHQPDADEFSTHNFS